MAKKGFIYYDDWSSELLNLPDKLRLKIDDAVKRYVLYGEEPSDPEVLYSMFGLMRKVIDRDAAKYEDTCKKRRISGAKGGRAKSTKSKQMVANGSKSKQELASVANLANINKDTSKEVCITDNISEIIVGNDGKRYFHQDGHDILLPDNAPDYPSDGQKYYWDERNDMWRREG